MGRCDGRTFPPNLQAEEFDVAHGILIGAAEWLIAKGIRQWTAPDFLSTLPALEFQNNQPPGDPVHDWSLRHGP
jgi:hypothetical protein